MQAFDDPNEVEVYTAFELGIPVETVREVTHLLLERAGELLAQRGSVYLYSVGRLTAVTYSGRAPVVTSLNEPRPAEGRPLTDALPKVEIRLQKAEHLKNCLRKQRLFQQTAMQAEADAKLRKVALPHWRRADQVGS